MSSISFWTLSSSVSVIGIRSSSLSSIRSSTRSASQRASLRDAKRKCGMRTCAKRAITPRLSASVGALTAAKPTGPCVAASRMLPSASDQPGGCSRFTFRIWRSCCPRVISSPGWLAVMPVPSRSALAVSGVVPNSRQIRSK